MALIALAHGAATGAFSINLRVTQGIQGASFLVDRWGTKCSGDALNATPCSCFGGAARRHAFLAGGRETTSLDVVTLDAGEHFSGSGLFFPALRGNASGAFFAATHYDA
eukprot:7014596-Prymnesium_polylepis.1